MVSWTAIASGCVLLAAHAHAASLDTLPIAVLPDGATKISSDNFPARSQLKAAIKYVVQDPSGGGVKEVVEGKNGTKTNTRRSRFLEASQSDMEKLTGFLGKAPELNIGKLPKKAESAPIPWPGPYWAYYQDGINVVWDESGISPAEKYAKAFGKDVTDFMNKISAQSGIDAASDHKVCKTKEECEELKDGSTCAIRKGKDSGYCVPMWFGVCHAWSPASILEEEPKCPVTENGVTFKPMDIKGLMTQIYDGTDIETVFLGVRFNGVDAETKKDEEGRYIDLSRRDIGPGFFHIAAANLLGIKKHGFVVDADAGSQVWNQPVRGYELLARRKISMQQALVLLGSKEKTYAKYNPDAKKFAYVRMRFEWITETFDDGPLVSSGRVDSQTSEVLYRYILELDDKNNILGGEWVSESKEKHPDFMWIPTQQPPKDTEIGVGMKYSDVKMLLEKSVKGNC